MTNAEQTAGGVADAVPGDWTAKLPAPIRPYAQLARWDRPIGWWLLLWPCWWSVGLALNAWIVPASDLGPSAFDDLYTEGGLRAATAGAWTASAALLALFWVGAVAMRGAGCTWNDITDRHLDAGVARTRSRPLPTGRVTVRGAFAFLAVQLLVGLAVLLSVGFVGSLNAIWLGFLSVPIVVAYPFAKRITNWPQIVLGLAFSWGALMGWMALFGSLSAAPFLLYAGCVAWTVGYDTIYAHQDREDDALMGIRSTARLFNQRTKPALVLIYAIALVLFAAAFWTADVHPFAWIGLALAGLHMARQIARLDINDASQCLALFRSNSQIGWLIFAGLIAGAVAASF